MIYADTGCCLTGSKRPGQPDGRIKKRPERSLTDCSGRNVVIVLMLFCCIKSSCSKLTDIIKLLVCYLYLYRQIAFSSWLHSKVSSIVQPATLHLRAWKRISLIAHSLTAINLEHLLIGICMPFRVLRQSSYDELPADSGRHVMSETETEIDSQ